jgi:hypothetical protein
MNSSQICSWSVDLFGDSGPREFGGLFFGLATCALGTACIKIMTESWGKLRIDVVDDEIIISLPATTYSVTYFKRPNSPQLLAKNISQADDKRTPLKLSDFLARAWRAANSKARELGWIA